MKFSTDRDALLEALQHVIGAVERKQTNPVLNNLLLRGDDDQLTLIGTDNEIEMQARLSMELQQPGDCTVPARKIHDICRHLPEGARVDLSVADNKVTLKSGRSRFSLSTLPAEQFPLFDPLDEQPAVGLLASELHGCISATAFSMANADVRFYLNGLLFELGQGRLCCVSTDGHRMAWCQHSTNATPPEELRVIMPRKSVLELQRLLSHVDGESAVQLRSNGERMQLDLDDGLRMSTRLIDGRFPDYNRVIPIDGDKELVIDVTTLRQSLARASVLTNDKYRGVRLSLEPGLLVLTTHSPEQEESRDELEVDYDGATADIGFNITYLQDVLGAVGSENVRLVIKDGNSSALLLPDQGRDSKYVIMPMRL